MTGIESKEEIWDNALTLANNICIQISNRYNDDDEIEKAECANDCAKQIRVGIGQYSEALSSLPVQEVQPTDIENYFIKKEKKQMDEMGWTGMFVVSAKDVLDFIIDRKNNNL